MWAYRVQSAHAVSKGLADILGTTEPEIVDRVRRDIRGSVRGLPEVRNEYAPRPATDHLVATVIIGTRPLPNIARHVVNVIRALTSFVTPYWHQLFLVRVAEGPAGSPYVIG